MVIDDINVCIQYERLNIEIITNKNLIKNINVFITSVTPLYNSLLVVLLYLIFTLLKAKIINKCEILNRVLQVKNSLELYLLF